MRQSACRLCGKTFICDNGRWSTTCTCAKDKPDELKAAQEKFDRECPLSLAYARIPIAEFDRLARAGEFADGPHVSTFGDGPGEPYNPVRRVFGTLVDGREVESEKVGET